VLPEGVVPAAREVLIPGVAGPDTGLRNTVAACADASTGGVLVRLRSLTANAFFSTCLR
jgi:hypothetical protein